MGLFIRKFVGLWVCGVEGGSGVGLCVGPGDGSTRGLELVLVLRFLDGLQYKDSVYCLGDGLRH